MISVSLVDVMGDDLKVVNSARVSFSKYKEDFEEGDVRLIKYLARHNHWTPFAHCQATFHISAPIPVARQLYKHKVGLSENEVSRRYVDDMPQFFMPDEWRQKADNKKQGSSSALVPQQEEVSLAYADVCRTAFEVYDYMLEQGVCPEQARLVLPQGMVTQWYWTGSLSAFARVCQQRIHEDAQQETRYVAELIAELLAPHFPVSWEVLCGHLIPHGEPIH